MKTEEKNIKNKAREYTSDEIREQFLDHIRGLIDYWSDESRAKNDKDKLSGLAHSILSTIDGGSVNLPGFILAPCPHETDKQWYIDNGKNYYPENKETNSNIAGVLHEQLFIKKF
jgi:hypothetical protein